MKKLDKVLSVIMVVIMLACICTNVFAQITTDSIKADQSLDGADDTMAKIGSTILTVVTNVAIILAVVVIAVLGVKYMMGSLEEKAEYKKSMIPYLVGAVLVFGAGIIGKAVVGFAGSLGK